MPEFFFSISCKQIQHTGVSFVPAMKLKQLFPVFFVLSLLGACERAADFKLDEVGPKLVVEATIENGQAPLVYLSSSLGYFSAIDQSVLAGSFVHNAEVWVSNGTQTHQLKEYSYPVGTYNFFYYTNDIASPGTAFLGELNKNYTLRIRYEGKEYTAVTRIPDTTRRIDSFFWKPAPAGNEPGKIQAMVRAYDKPGFGDYVRYFTKRNSEPYYPGLNSVFDDQIIDGTSYEVQVERGIPRNGSVPEGYSFFDKGDTITLKLSNIDKATYDFWRTMEFTYASVGNPFSSPTKVMSNLTGGALGYFGGYASQFRTIIVPR